MRSLWRGSRCEVDVELAAQHLRRFVPGCSDADCKKIDGFQPRIATRVDAAEGFEVHCHVEGDAVVCAVPAHLDAQRRDLAEAAERVVRGDRAGVGRAWG